MAGTLAGKVVVAGAWRSVAAFLPDKISRFLNLNYIYVLVKLELSRLYCRAKDGDNVLDVCCGSGDLTFLLSERVGPYGKAVGLDFSKEQLLTASTRQKLRSKTCYKNIKWMEGNALDLPFPDSSFDAVTIGYGLRNVIDRHKAMTEICRVLKPGSTISILDFNKSINPLSTTIQELMIDNIVVPVASGYGLEDEYKYLKSSIKNFLTGNELEMLALEVGFSTAKHFEIGFGLMGNLVAIR
uniref:2-phytyl-1,4-beta-naphthoquinone methyltransferase, chloroplastic n=1 Tax=Nicotiana tabacum TaxID=4097 RepID=A0A1S4D0M7_TOBAC|nr:PREDICTED: 2-phytyl-1,4-beta-naphthoquinone methyltransferase, chloroplastic-like [Nicotiana tabacum]